MANGFRFWVMLDSRVENPASLLGSSQKSLRKHHCEESKWRTPQVCNSTCFIFLIPQQSSTIFNPFPISTLDSWCRLMQIEGFWQFETDEQRLVQLVFSLTHLVHDFAPPLLCTLARAYVSWWSTGHHGCLSCHLNSLNLFQCGETQSIYDTMHAYIYIYFL